MRHSQHTSRNKEIFAHIIVVSVMGCGLVAALVVGRAIENGTWPSRPEIAKFLLMGVAYMVVVSIMSRFIPLQPFTRIRNQGTTGGDSSEGSDAGKCDQSKTVMSRDQEQPPRK